MPHLISTLLLGVSAVVAQQATTGFTPKSLTSTPLVTGSAIIVPAPAYPNGFAASVISGDACTAAYELTCTDASLCSYLGNSFTATRAPTSYAYIESATVLDSTPYTYTRHVECTYSVSALPTCTVTGIVTLLANSTTTISTVTDSSRITYITAAATAGATLPTEACQGITYQYQALTITSAASAQTQTQTVVASSSSGSSTPIGAIVGGVVGGVALIAIVAVIVLLIMRKRRQMKPTLPEMQRYPNGQ